MKIKHNYLPFNIFGADNYKLHKPCRLIEAFAGIGSQYKALSQFNDVLPIEHYKIIEWAVNSIEAYNALHIGDKTDYGYGLTKEDMIKRILGVSVDYVSPLSADALLKKPIGWIKNVYNNVVATNNLVNISNVHGKDLDIVDKDKYSYILTYSFPCQDISGVGKRAGLDVGTRSGLLWEIDRILAELSAEDSLPDVLMLENVPDLLSPKYKEGLSSFLNHLTDLGYTNFIHKLNGYDFLIPQIRVRVIIISILDKKASYSFPSARPIENKLNDFLENYHDINPNCFLSKPFRIDSMPTAPNIDTGVGDTLQKQIIDMLITSNTLRENDVIFHSWSKNRIIKRKSKVKIMNNNLSPTLTTHIEGMGVVVNVGDDLLAIRKFTPKESLRLMGFQDDDYNKLLNIGQSEHTIFHESGDSIVVPMLIGVFGMLIMDETMVDYKIRQYVSLIKEKR